MSKNPENTPYISLMGNIGVGKSTAASLIAEKKGYFLISEKFNENPHWEDASVDRKKHIYRAQIHFLISKLEQVNEITQIAKTGNHKGFVDDFSIHQDYAFAYANFMQGNISERDWDVYERIFSNLIKLVIEPSLLILLQTRNVHTNLERIKKRGRESEQTIDARYLTTLGQSFLHVLNTHATNIPVAKFDTEKINFADNRTHQRKLLHFVNKNLKKLK